MQESLHVSALRRDIHEDVPAGCAHRGPWPAKLHARGMRFRGRTLIDIEQSGAGDGAVEHAITDCPRRVRALANRHRVQKWCKNRAATGALRCTVRETKMNSDQLWGRLGAAKAKVEELAGTVVGHKALVARGKTNLAVSRARAEFGDAKRAVEKRRLMARRGRLGHAR
jgi:uncharacterized protein YjbJ (UPF0337 family)